MRRSHNHSSRHISLDKYARTDIQALQRSLKLLSATDVLSGGCIWVVCQRRGMLDELNSLRIMALYMTSCVSVLVLLVVHPTRCKLRVCPDNWIRREYTCYGLLNSGSYSSVELECRNMGGELVALREDVTNEFVAKMLEHLKIESAFTGLTDIYMEGSFEWPEGDTLEFSNWIGGTEEPYNKTLDCVIIKQDAFWYNVNCDNPHPAVCTTATLSGKYCKLDGEQFDLLEELPKF